METTGEYRVRSRAPDGTAVCVPLDDGEGEPIRVESDDITPGNRVELALSWEEGAATVEAADVLEDSRISYARGVTGLFEDALSAMDEARRERLGTNARTTYSTDGEPNGAVYVFADQPGERDLYAEFVEGVAPLEPLLDRLDEHEDCPHHVFVLDPAEHDFLVLYLVLRTDSVLARTVADTYC